MMSQGTQKTDNRTDSQNADSRKKPAAVTIGWMGKRGLLQQYWTLSANNTPHLGRLTK